MLKHRLVVGLVLTLMVSGCAAGRAFRKGQEASRSGDWDTAVAEYTKAVQERPDKAEYKISLERATQTRGATITSPGRGVSSRRINWTRHCSNTGGPGPCCSPIAWRPARVVELERTIRDRDRGVASQAAIDALREQARRASAPC